MIKEMHNGMNSRMFGSKSIGKEPHLVLEKKLLYHSLFFLIILRKMSEDL